MKVESSKRQGMGNHQNADDTFFYIAILSDSAKQLIVLHSIWLGKYGAGLRLNLLSLDFGDGGNIMSGREVRIFQCLFSLAIVDYGSLIKLINL